MNRPVWCELDLSAIRQNIHSIRRISQNIPLFAVIKQDAYGHGLIPVARILQQEAVSHFAVATLDEAIACREAGIQGEILILGYTPIEQAPLLAHHRLSQNLFCAEMFEEWKQALKSLNITFHLKLDTGMNRLGWKNEKNLFQRISDYLPHLQSVFTHLPKADEDWELTIKQIGTFWSIVQPWVEANHIPIHCINSSAFLQCVQRNLPIPGDFLRLGILLYGVSPMLKTTFPLQPALSVKSRIIQVKEVKRGEGVSYGHTWKAKRKSIIGVVPIGYADGYSRALSNQGRMRVCGRYAPIVGRVTMDYTMLNITEIPQAGRNSEVTVLGEGITASEVANIAGTIPYEVLCSLGSRIPRIVINSEAL